MKTFFYTTIQLILGGNTAVIPKLSREQSLASNDSDTPYNGCSDWARILSRFVWSLRRDLHGVEDKKEKKNCSSWSSWRSYVVSGEMKRNFKIEESLMQFRRSVMQTGKLMMKKAKSKMLSRMTTKAHEYFMMTCLKIRRKELNENRQAK